jgi:hypothetical protein
VSRRRTERRLQDVGARLKALREELRVTEEQLVELSDAEDDSRLRSLVSETPVAAEEYRQAARHAESLRRSRAKTVAEIAKAEAQQGQLLEQFMAERD